jgi:hypothetical protein
LDIAIITNEVVSIKKKEISQNHKL